jgi:hypothetical protein
VNHILSKQLLEMARKDEEVRNELVRQGTLFDGYHPEMEKIHNTNADSFEAILVEWGWPGRDEIGVEASRAAWLIVQHAIGRPHFQKRCLELLQGEVKRGQFDPALAATLEDRIAVFEGRPQIYGTQFDWDVHGQLSPHEILNPCEVDARRLSVGLPPLSETIQEIRQHAEKEGNMAPRDQKKRTADFLIWAKKVGWR